MHFENLYSSSDGNLYLVTARSGEKLLIECGVPWKKLIKAIDYDLTHVVGCLVSHAHQDHCKAIHHVLKNGIQVFASWDTLELTGTDGNPSAHAIQAGTYVNAEGRAQIWPFEFYPFDVPHDIPNLGFVVIEKPADESLFYAVDCFNIKPSFGRAFDIIALGCSYDEQVLASRVDAGVIIESLATRLRTAHLSRSKAMKYLTQCCKLPNCRELHLLHMSKSNIDREATRQWFEDELFVPVYAKAKYE